MFDERGRGARRDDRDCRRPTRPARELQVVPLSQVARHERRDATRSCPGCGAASRTRSRRRRSATSRAPLAVTLDRGERRRDPATLAPKARSADRSRRHLGINPQMIVRTEPRHWITDFEPNYLAFVEFYDEDFPWRYTPGGARRPTHRLAPWLALLVLKDDASSARSQPAPAGPLPSIESTAASHCGRPVRRTRRCGHGRMSTSTQASDAGRCRRTRRRARRAAAPNAGPGYLPADVARAGCEPNTAYHAFVVPTFEVGRKAGLGRDRRRRRAQGSRLRGRSRRRVPGLLRVVVRHRRGRRFRGARRARSSRARCDMPTSASATWISSTRTSALPADHQSARTTWSGSKARSWRRTRDRMRSAAIEQRFPPSSNGRSTCAADLVDDRGSPAATIRSSPRRSMAAGMRWSSA